MRLHSFIEFIRKYQILIGIIIASFIIGGFLYISLNQNMRITNDSLNGGTTRLPEIGETISEEEFNRLPIGDVNDLPTIISQWRPRIAYIECTWRNVLGEDVVGSGSGLFVAGTVITNEHVVVQQDVTGGRTKAEFCKVRLPGDNEVFVNSENLYNWGNNRDVGALVIKNPTPYMRSLEDDFSPICMETAQIGEGIVILGYPGIGSSTDITATEGIISGYEGYFYITSAKIEEGNSGGVAILVRKNCYLGIPTWAQLGAVESLGRILDAREALSNY